MFLEPTRENAAIFILALAQVTKTKFKKIKEETRTVPDSSRLTAEGILMLVSLERSNLYHMWVCNTTIIALDIIIIVGFKRKSLTHYAFRRASSPPL